MKCQNVYKPQLIIANVLSAFIGMLKKPSTKLEKYDASINRLGKQPESRLVIRLSDAANDPEMSITGFLESL